MTILQRELICTYYVMEVMDFFGCSKIMFSLILHFHVLLNY